MKLDKDDTVKLNYSNIEKDDLPILEARTRQAKNYSQSQKRRNIEKSSKL